MNSPETGDRECPVTLDENLEAGRVRPLPFLDTPQRTSASANSQT